MNDAVFRVSLCVIGPAFACFVIMTALGYIAPRSSTVPPSSPSLNANEPLERDSFNAKRAVLRILKDPDSAKFGNIFNSQSSPGKKICGFVNARNGFGGYTGMKPFVYYIGSNDVVIASEEYLLKPWETDCLKSPAPSPSLKVWDGTKAVDLKR